MEVVTLFIFLYFFFRCFTTMYIYSTIYGKNVLKQYCKYKSFVQMFSCVFLKLNCALDTSFGGVLRRLVRN